MSLRSRCLTVLAIASILAATACGSSQAPKRTPVWTGGTDPSSLISRASLFATLTDLTAIQPYSGWRSAGTEGEREALDYVARRFDGFMYLKQLGQEVEREEFRIFMTTEFWESRLALRVDGQDHDVPVSAIRGSRDVITQAVHFDSDGKPGDAERNPMRVAGEVRLVLTSMEFTGLPAADVKGKVILAAYSLFDTVTARPEGAALDRAEKLLRMEPAAVVLVTEYSNKAGQSHGSFAGESGGAFAAANVEPYPPVFFVRLEDLAPAGLKNWDDLPRVEAADLVWDADVLSPATSGNLVVRIPGADTSKAFILGAHVDSANTPGALDDGSGVAALIEVARVLDAAKLKPPVDLYLAFFGSHEAVLYGSHYFANSHQELLDRSLAMLQVDCLSRPIDDVRDMQLSLTTWSYTRQGDPRMAWALYLQDVLAGQGIAATPEDRTYAASDNTSLAGYDVPQANLNYLDEDKMWPHGGDHYAGHLHDPYETVELAREVGDVLEQMARGALAAAWRTAAEAPALRVPDPPKRRAVVVASHTEAVHMTPAETTDFGMTLAWAGFDVDLMPYGRAVTPADLAGAAFVLVLPVLDYPNAIAGNESVYDEAWTAAEIAALEQYVAQGGFLILTNSAHRLKHANRVYPDANEDWADMNALAGRFGVTYVEGVVEPSRVDLTGTLPLRRGISQVELAPGNGVPFKVEQGEVLAAVEAGAVIALVDYRDGQVLALADSGIFGGDRNGSTPHDMLFWRRIVEQVGCSPQGDC